jgi:hypothetical protein
LFAWRHTVSDCGCTPPTAHSTNTGAVEHAQAALDFDGEVDVPGGVDDVEAVFGRDLSMPFQNAVGGSDVMVMPALLLLLHPVHGRGAVVHFADLVADAGVEQDALRRGRLARVDVGHDAEVAVTLDGSGARHGYLSF